MSDPIKRIQTPVRFDYTVSAGRALSRFLAGLVEGRILGRRCPSCRKVYVPPRGACPTCGVPFVPAAEEVEVEDTGTLTTFCVVNVPFEGQTMKLPYVYASVVLDGADIPLLHLVNVPAEQARMGMRVRAAWTAPEERRPTLETIKWFEPTGEPDAPFDSYKEHL
jgi:uncharacterized OB-fold protein